MWPNPLVTTTASGRLLFMAVKIIENYISREDCDRYSEFFDAHSYESSREFFRNALGYPSSLIASKTSAKTGVIHDNNEPVNFELGALYDDVKKKAEEFFGVKIDLCQSNYQLLLPGASNPLHADSTKLDGSPIQEDGTPEELEWSGLLYLNTHGEDFEGGMISWPEFDIDYLPKAGDLVLFKGDVEHRHGVSEVTSGERRNIVFFWANKGNVSDENFFDVNYVN